MINAKPFMTRSSKQLLGRLAVAALSASLGACGVGPVRSSSSADVAVPAAPTAQAVTPAHDTRDADKRFSAALKLMREHQVPEAQAAFQALSRDFPEFSGPLTALGILYAQGKQKDQALASFAKAVAANPGNAVALNWLGSLYRENNDLRHAEETYKKAISAKPDYAAAHLNLGILYDVALHQPQNALVEYRQFQRIAGTQNLMVGVWIKEIEAAANTRTASAGEAP